MEKKPYKDDNNDDYSKKRKCNKKNKKEFPSVEHLKFFPRFKSILSTLKY